MPKAAVAEITHKSDRPYEIHGQLDNHCCRNAKKKECGLNCLYTVPKTKNRRLTGKILVHRWSRIWPGPLQTSPQVYCLGQEVPAKGKRFQVSSWPAEGLWVHCGDKKEVWPRVGLRPNGHREACLLHLSNNYVIKGHFDVPNFMLLVGIWGFWNI